jgi:glycosyltransferase involved in cell wall biosynthesis
MGAMPMERQHEVRFSIVVPIFNEEGSAPTLHARLTTVMRGLREPYEIVFVDDGSTDRSPAILKRIRLADPSVRVVTLRRNFGQTPALKAGFDAARGEVIIAMDGDLQHDPAEIPSFIEKMDEGFDLVSGWRFERKDKWLSRRLPSRIANWSMAKLSGVPLHDFGTTFKAYRREIIQGLPLYGELHRFIPALAAASGARIAEIHVSNPPRQFGKSNYGISRTFRVFLDLLSTKFWLDYSTKPMHFFGFFGLAATGGGLLTGSMLLFQKLIAREAFTSNTTLAIATIAMLLAGMQILCLGLASEMLSRTYYESQKKPIYVIREAATPSEELDYGHRPARTMHNDGETRPAIRPNPFQFSVQSRPESPMLKVSADQPRLVRKVPRDGLA